MSGQTWPKIEGFARIFNGAGHTISNLNVTGDSEIGFIGHLKGGTVKNLLLVDAINNGYASVGGIVGFQEGGTVIACAVSGCTVSGEVWIGGIAASCSVTATFDEETSGHITGHLLRGSINACYYDGDGNGIGNNDIGASATRVDGDITWQAAAEAMNKQLAGNDYIWEVNTDKATKATLPLVLVPNPDVQ